MDPVLTETMAVPPPEPARPPADGPADWIRRNLARSPVDAVVSLIAAVVVGYIAYRLIRYVFVTGRWEIVQDNLKLFMVGRYPLDDLWRISVVVVAIGLYGGLLAGYIAIRRRRLGLDADVAPQPWWRRVLAVLGRQWPLIGGTLLLLLLTTSAGPWITVGATVAAVVVGRVVGRWLPKGAGWGLVLLGLVGFVVVVLFLLRALGWDKWGGLMLNLFLAFTAIVLCFPLGVLLALGRRSKLPIIRWLSIAYIELFRGVPLFVLLLLSSIALGLLLAGRRPHAGPRRAGDRRLRPVHRGLHRRDRARRAAVAAPRSDRGSHRARPRRRAHDGADRAAAGAAQRHPGDRRPVHQPVQGHHAGGRGDGVPRPLRRARGRHRRRPRSRART